MKIITILGLTIFFLGVSIGSPKVTITGDSHSSHQTIFGALVQHLQLENTRKGTILVHTIPTDANYEWIQYLQSYTPIVLSHFSCLFTNSKYEYGRTCNIKNPKSFDALIFITKESIWSINGLENIVYDLKVQLEWSKSPTVYVIDLSIYNNCKMANYTLQVIWYHQVLTAYYLCYNSGLNATQIYTYNPYMNQASDQWKFVNSVPEFNGNEWSLFAQNYSSDSLGRGSDFDRSTISNKYFLTVTLRHPFIRKIMTKYPNLLKPPTFEPLSTIASALKINYRVFQVPEKRQGKGRIKEFRRHIESRLMYDDKMNDFRNGTYEYPFQASIAFKYGICTRTKGFKTPLENISEFYGIWTILFTAWILIITFIVIWLVKNRNVAFAIFDVIRLLTNTSIHLKMKTFSLKIFFAMIFIYFLVIQATFAGHLTEFLTKNAPRRSVQTLDDLDDSYSISIKKTMGYVLPYTLREHVNRSHKVEECLKVLSTTDQAACIWPYTSLKRSVENNTDLQISKSVIGNTLVKYRVDHKWPLAPHVVKVIQYLWESGIWNQLEVRNSWKRDYRNRVKAEAQKRSFSSVRPISFEDLKYFFFMLAGGLTTATIVFCIEIHWTKIMFINSELKKAGTNLWGRARK